MGAGSSSWSASTRHRRHPLPGGPRPCGYADLGEVFVFLFFGLVAVNGSYYVQLEELDALPLGLWIAVGFLATAILVVNNVRDLETDRRAGKNTSAVRMGHANAVNMYRLLVGGAFVLLPFLIWAGDSKWWPLLGLLAIPLAIEPVPPAGNPHRRPGAEQMPCGDRGAARDLQPVGDDRAVASACGDRLHRGDPLRAPVQGALCDGARDIDAARDGAAADSGRRGGEGLGKRCRCRCAVG